MAPNRGQVKSTMVDPDQIDQEYNVVIAKGHTAQLEIDKEKNRHAKEMKELDLGTIGCLIGNGKNAPSSIAAVCSVFGLIGFAVCLVAAANTAKFEFWSQNAERSLSVALTALAFMFGKSASSVK